MNLWLVWRHDNPSIRPISKTRLVGRSTSWLHFLTMGDGIRAGRPVATLQVSPDKSKSDEPQAPKADVAGSIPGGESQTEYDAGRRRYSIAATLAIVITAVPFLWILLGPWESPNFLRRTIYQDNFYDLQARAMFHGHLWLANGAIGIEAFVHGGRQYTYFGLFPSLIRMPILLMTNSLDGKLTAPSILTSWLLTGFFTSLLLWRVRVLIRGRAVMGWVEAVASGVLVATIMGGTIWMLLASTPFVFNEDIAWSICLTVGSMFALLGLVERPSWRRVFACFALILAANLDRATTGWACVVGAGMIAAWFATGHGGPENRRWSIPTLGAGLIPLLVGCAVNYSKFGVLFGVSNFEQVWTHVNAYRRKFLAANHNSEEGIVFVPTNILAYLRPDGLRLSSVFPFITLPARPPSALSGVLFDRRYRTASLPASTPLLFLLSCWGLVTAFRPKPIGKVALTRFLLLAAGSAGAALLLWGYIAPRYLGDFVPFLALASAVGFVDIWRRLEDRRRSLRMGALGITTVVALFAIVANVGFAITPNEEWNTTQVVHYVETQKSFSDVTGHPLNSRVARGSSLPAWGPADELYVVGNCDGLYISNGEDYSTVPTQQFQRMTWMVVERGHVFQHVFGVTFNRPQTDSTESSALVRVGPSSVFVSARAAPRENLVQVTFGVTPPMSTVSPASIDVNPGSTHQITVITDPDKHITQVFMDGRLLLDGELVTSGSISSAVSNSPAPKVLAAGLSVIDTTASSPEPTLCQSLIH